MAQKFGNTWWGNEWLRSLNHIDYQNRIPRGATYARKGAVKEIKLQGNTLTGKVAGSRPRPYGVTIDIPTFSAQQTERLMQQLIARPGIISSLINRELDPEVLHIAKSGGLKIFPERWSDLKMQCNCPDWAVPCKHLAAVVYMLSREIDNNPFLVFEMHNIDLLGELKKRGITVDEMQQKAQVADIQDVIGMKPNKEVSDHIPEFARIDFTKLIDHSEVLLMLLPDNPPFSPSGNFKEAYVAEMRRISKSVERFFARKLAPEKLFSQDSTPVEIDVDTRINLSLNYLMNWRVDSVSPTYKEQSYTVHDLPVALLGINPDFLPDYHPNVKALHQALFCALHLLRKGAVAPQILRLPKQTYAIHWIPAYIDNEVRQLMNKLEEICPDTLLKVQSAGKSTQSCMHHQAEWLVSFFLDGLISNLSGNNDNSALHLFFFKNLHQPFKEVGEKETPSGIKAWTASFTLNESDYRPVFSVSENKTEGFDLNIGVEQKLKEGANIISLQEVLSSPHYDEERFRILRSFTLISTLLREINRYINAGAEKPIHYTHETFIPFLLQVVPLMQMLDIKVFMPKSLQKLIRPQATLHLKKKQNSEKGFFSLSNLFEFDWEVALGDELVSMDEFKRLQLHAGSLIKFKQSYIYVDAESLQKLHDAFSGTERLTPAQLLQAALLEEYESAPIRLSDEVKQLIAEITQQEKIGLPQQLNATLRPYQERGFSWMYRNMRIGFGSVLADDMGLGKTLQSITLMLKLKEEGRLETGRILIVAPTGLLTNWQAEINRFAPSLTLFVYHGSDRNLKSFDADILLTTYGMLRTDNAKLKKMKWLVLFIDEAQNIKNQDAAQSKAVRNIPAHTHIALSGTPVENRLSEFWSIMDFANKGYLDTLKVFKERFATPIQLYNDTGCAARFRKITAPFMMRRMKTDKSIISDLPDKIEQNDYASLKTEQAALYNKTLEAAMNEIEGIDTTDHEALFKRQGLILQMILALKQICNVSVSAILYCRPFLALISLRSIKTTHYEIKRE